jgi:hypothetical protein
VSQQAMTRAFYLDAGIEPIFAMLDEPTGSAPVVGLRGSSAVHSDRPGGHEPVLRPRNFVEEVATPEHPTFRSNRHAGNSAGRRRDPECFEAWASRERCQPPLSAHPETLAVHEGFDVDRLPAAPADPPRTAAQMGPRLSRRSVAHSAGRGRTKVQEGDATRVCGDAGGGARRVTAASGPRCPGAMDPDPREAAVVRRRRGNAGGVPSASTAGRSGA